MALAGGVAVGDSFAVGLAFDRAVSAQMPVGAAILRPWLAPGVVMGGGGPAVVRALGPQGCAAWFDGYLDNQSHLSHVLRGHGDTRPLSPADLLLSAFDRWGVDFLDHFVGRFGCSLWHAPSQTLILGRDALGERPLHYWHDPKTVLYATDPRGLLVHETIPRRLDLHYVAEMLAPVRHDDHRTVYQGIRVIPPGQVLVVQQGRAVLHRYWQPEHLPVLPLSGPGDAADLLRQAVDRAVIGRLPASGPVGCHITGGLDSTAVTALAARHLAQSGRKLVAVTLVPGPGGLADTAQHYFDEGPAARRFAATLANVDHVLVPDYAQPWVQAIDQVAAVMGGAGPYAHVAAGMMATARAMQQRRLSTVLTGAFGNLTASYDGGAALTHLLQAGRWGRWLRLLLARRRFNRAGWMGLLGESLGPLAPGMLLPLRKMLGKPAHGSFDQFGVNPAFARHYDLERRSCRESGAAYRYACGGNGRAGRLDLIQYQSAQAAGRDESMWRSFGFRTENPLIDRNVVELCLAIPPEYFVWNGEPRWLMRQAMRGIVPDFILNDHRTGMGPRNWFLGFQPARRDVAAELDRLSASPLAQHCLDLPRLRRLVEHWPAQGLTDDHAQYGLTLARAIVVGRFLRQFEGGNQ